MAKSVHSTFQITEFWASNHFHGHRGITSSTIGMLIASRNICEQTGRSQEFSKSSKSSCVISLLLNIPKWKQFGIIASNPSGKPHKVTHKIKLSFSVWADSMLDEGVTNFLQTQSLQTSKLHLAFKWVQEQWIQSFMEEVSMAKQLRSSPSFVETVWGWPLLCFKITTQQCRK